MDEARSAAVIQAARAMAPGTKALAGVRSRYGETAMSSR